MLLMIFFDRIIYLLHFISSHFYFHNLVDFGSKIVGCSLISMWNEYVNCFKGVCVASICTLKNLLVFFFICSQVFWNSSSLFIYRYIHRSFELHSNVLHKKVKTWPVAYLKLLKWLKYKKNEKWTRHEKSYVVTHTNVWNEKIFEILLRHQL